MAIKKGTDNIVKVYRGSTEITKIYRGTELIYSASPAPQPMLSNKIYGHTRSASSTVTIKVNGTSYSVTSDADRYFELDCSNITITSLNQCIYNQTSTVADVTFDIDTSNCTNFSLMVASCRNVTSIDCSKMDTSKATNMSSMFYDNRAAATIIPPANGFAHSDRMSNLQFMFFNCYLLTTLDLSDMGDCDNVVSMNGMFRGCSALQTLDLSGFYIDSANISMDNVFGGCSALTSIKVTGCDASVVTALLSMLTASSLSFVQSGDYLIKQ
jgi:surface protein